MSALYCILSWNWAVLAKVLGNQYWVFIGMDNTTVWTYNNMILYIYCAVILHIKYQTHITFSALWLMAIISLAVIIFPRNVKLTTQILCFRQQRSRRSRRSRRRSRRPPQHHNSAVSAITFEGFKLRSLNLTHALFIQIYRTSSIIDIVVPSKMAAGGHFVQKKVAYRSEMARNAIESDFRHPKWPPATILSKKN